MSFIDVTPRLRDLNTDGQADAFAAHAPHLDRLRLGKQLTGIVEHQSGTLQNLPLDS